MGCRALLLRCIPGDREFLLKPTVGTAKSHQAPVTGFAKDRAGLEDCAFVS